MTTLFPELDLAQPVFACLAGLYETGYGGAKPLKPIPVDCPDSTKKKILTEWARQVMSNSCVSKVVLSGRSPGDDLSSMGLGAKTVLEPVRRASSLILHAKSLFYSNLARLYDLYWSLDITLFASNAEARSSFERAIKALAYIEVIENSIERKHERPGWIDPREVEFLHALFISYFG